VNEVSQLPVLQAGQVVGLLDESDLLLRVIDDENASPTRCARR